MVRDVLVVGIGNLLKMDDGIGIHVIEYLRRPESDLPDWITLLDGGTAGYDLVEPFSEFEKIVIVDAVMTGSRPGSIFRFPADRVVSGDPVFSQHGFGIKNIMNMLKLRGCSPRAIVVGIVPEDTRSDGIGLSTSVSNVLPAAAEQVLSAAQELYNRGDI